jgi:Circadian oscillating protein COP23
MSQKWYQKTEVVVALISLTGTVLTAILAPVLSPLIQPQPKLDDNKPHANPSEPEKQPAQNKNLSIRSTDIEFVCNSSKNSEKVDVLTTVIRSSSKGNVPMFFWKDTSFGDSWTPEKRCQEVSRRLEVFNDRGELKYIASGELNGYPTLCVKKELDDRCNDNNLLITLKLGEDASKILQEIIAFRDSKGAAITRDGDFYIDVFEYWRQAPTTSSGSSSPRF